MPLKEIHVVALQFDDFSIPIACSSAELALDLLEIARRATPTAPEFFEGVDIDHVPLCETEDDLRACFKRIVQQLRDLDEE